MNPFRTVFLPATLALALAASSAVLAQKTPAPEMPASQNAGMHGRHGAMNRALRSLNLTTAQQQQITRLMQQYHQAHPAGSAHDPIAQQQLHASILAILTPEQRAQLTSQLSEAGPEMRENGPMNGITLSDAQKAQLKALRDRYHAQMLAILTPEQKAQFEKNAVVKPAGIPARAGGAYDRHMGGMIAGITLSADQQAKIQTLMAAFRQAHQGSRPDPAARQALRDHILQILTPEQQVQYKANAERLQRGGPFTPDPTPTPGR